MQASFEAIGAAARGYLSALDEKERASLRSVLDLYTGDFDEIIRAIKPVPAARPQTGWMLERAFTSPRLGLVVPGQGDPRG